MEAFRIRPGYKSKLLLVEFWGDHRSGNYPNIEKILKDGLQASHKLHPFLDTASIAIATDEFISLWQYEHGEYELDDDIWGFFIHAPNNNAQIMSDIERILIASRRFRKEEADFSKYQ